MEKPKALFSLEKRAFLFIITGGLYMQKLIVFAIIGFFAQLIDGALGMAYGVTSTSLLLMFGIAPAVASASVHLAEVVTTAASGFSHARFGNVDKYTVSRLTLPGAIGAFVGACFLSNLPGDVIKPYISLFLFSLGVYILLRFIIQKQIVTSNTRMSSKQLIPLGLFAGFIDSTGGGGWGPITTPVLLARGNEARKVIGSVDTSEFPVALAATIGFYFFRMGTSKLDLGIRFNARWDYCRSDCGMVSSNCTVSFTWRTCWWIDYLHKYSNTSYSTPSRSNDYYTFLYRCRTYHYYRSIFIYS